MEEILKKYSVYLAVPVLALGINHLANLPKENKPREATRIVSPSEKMSIMRKISKTNIHPKNTCLLGLGAFKRTNGTNGSAEVEVSYNAVRVFLIRHSGFDKEKTKAECAQFLKDSLEISKKDSNGSKVLKSIQKI